MGWAKSFSKGFMDSTIASKNKENEAARNQAAEIFAYQQKNKLAIASEQRKTTKTATMLKDQDARMASLWGTSNEGAAGIREMMKAGIVTDENFSDAVKRMNAASSPGAGKMELENMGAEKASGSVMNKGQATQGGAQKAEKPSPWDGFGKDADANVKKDSDLNSSAKGTMAIQIAKYNSKSSLAGMKGYGGREISFKGVTGKDGNIMASQAVGEMNQITRNLMEMPLDLGIKGSTAMNIGEALVTPAEPLSFKSREILKKYGREIFQNTPITPSIALALGSNNFEGAVDRSIAKNAGAQFLTKETNIADPDSFNMRYIHMLTEAAKTNPEQGKRLANLKRYLGVQ